MRWQKKAWVDREVMIEIARKFVEFKQENHGDDAVLLFADNLDAHCSGKAKGYNGEGLMRSTHNGALNRLFVFKG